MMCVCMYNDDVCVDICTDENLEVGVDGVELHKAFY